MVEPILSDNVVKDDLADAYQTWETPLTGLGVAFEPCLSNTSPVKTVKKPGFSPAEVVVVSQAQAKK